MHTHTHTYISTYRRVASGQVEASAAADPQRAPGGPPRKARAPKPRGEPRSGGGHGEALGGTDAERLGGTDGCDLEEKITDIYSFHIGLTMG